MRCSRGRAVLSGVSADSSVAVPIVVLVAALLFSALIACAACSKEDPVEAARESAEAQLQRLAEGDAVFAAELLEAVAFSPEDYGVTMDAFAQVMVDGFTYEIVSAEAQDTGNVVVMANISDRSSRVEGLRTAFRQANSSGIWICFGQSLSSTQ